MEEIEKLKEECLEQIEQINSMSATIKISEVHEERSHEEILEVLAATIKV